MLGVLEVPRGFPWESFGMHVDVFNRMDEEITKDSMTGQQWWRKFRNFDRIFSTRVFFLNFPQRNYFDISIRNFFDCRIFDRKISTVKFGVEKIQLEIRRNSSPWDCCRKDSLSLEPFCPMQNFFDIRKQSNRST